jgi:hypothetical protein
MLLRCSVEGKKVPVEPGGVAPATFWVHVLEAGSHTTKGWPVSKQAGAWVLESVGSPNIPFEYLDRIDE